MTDSSSPLKSAGPCGLSSTTGPVLFLAACLALTACSGGAESRQTRTPAASPATLSGFVGSPSIEDATVTVLLDGGASTVSTRSGADASYSLHLDKALAPPVRVQAQGGTDLLTGAANDTVLAALSFDDRPGRLSISHLSTLAAAMASCTGTATETSLNDAWARLQVHTGLDFVAATGNLSSAQLGALMRANLTLSESLERTRAALSGAGPAPETADLLDAIACDLADNGILDGSPAGADARLVSVFRSAEAGVLLETIAGTPYLAGQPADAQLDEALRRISGDSSAAIAASPVPDAILDRARADLALIAEAFDDVEVLDLSIALAGSSAEAAADARSTLNAARLTTLWSLPERVALSDTGQIDQLDAAMTTQQTTSIPVVSLSASGNAVNRNETVTLSWASAGARRCRAAGDWNGSRALEGTFATEPLTRASEFRLYCSGLGGVGAASTQVAVIDPGQRPVVSLSADDPSLEPNQTTVIRWTSSNATACTASGAWSGSQPVIGRRGIGPLSSDADYTLSCTGPGGTDTATLRVTVTAPTPPSQPAPTLTFNASPGTLSSGQSVSLSWSAGNATGCTAGNGWSGSRPTSGSETRGPLSESTSFSLTCSGPGGSVRRTRSVTVTTAPPSSPAPAVSLTAASTLVNAGGSTTLSWQSTNASSCTASGGWSGTRGTTGSAGVGPLSRQTTFSLSCSGSGGSALAMVSVSVRGNITLNWVAPTENVDGTPLRDLAGYRVYYGTNSRNYSNMRDVANPSATSTAFALASGDYYVAMTALDGEGNESAYSNEVLKSAP